MNLDFKMIKMEKIRNIIIGFLLVLLIATGFFFAYKYYKKLKQPIAPIVNAIPADVVAYIDFKNLYELWNTQNTENEIWKELQKIKLFERTQRDLVYLNEIFKLNDGIKQIVSSQRMIVSMHPSINNNLGFLFLCNVNQTFETNDVNDFINEIGLKTVKQIKKEKLKYYCVSTPSATYFYKVEQGVFMGSTDSLLLEKSLNQLNSGTSIAADKNFQFVNSSSGKKVDANVYINYNNLAAYASNITNTDNELNFDFLKKIAKWTEFDLIIKKNQLLLNGYTSVENSFPEVIKGDIPIETQIANVLPAKTLMYSNVNFNDYAVYHANYKQFIKSIKSTIKYDNAINKLNLKVKFNIRDNFIRWMGKSYAIAVVADKPENKSNTYVICNISDFHLADSCLKEIAVASQYGTDVVEKNKIILPSLLQLFLGELCPDYPEVWFETFGNFVVFAKSDTSLKAYKSELNEGNILVNNKSFSAFVTTNSTQSNFYTYFNLENAVEYIKQHLKPQFISGYEEIYPTIKCFPHLSYQISSIDNRFYTSFNLAFDKSDSLMQNNDSQNNEIEDGNQRSFANKLVPKLFMMKNSKDKNPFFLVSDQLNNLYCLDNDFNEKWKIVINGKILSEIYEVELKKKSKKFYLFNTDNFIYLFDSEGKSAENFPLKLSAKATTGLCLIDYEKKKDYRLLIPTIDKKLVCYKISGEKITDFKSNTFKEIIINSPQHIVFGGKDNILVSDKSGNFSILDRKGNERLKLKTPFYKNPDTRFYYDGRYLITNDLTNTLRFITTKGEVENKSFKNVKGETQFYYEDFNDDGTKDFIFLSQNQLLVLKKDGKEIFKYNFKAAVKPEAKFFENTKRGNLMVVSGIDKQLYVFDKKALLDESLAFKGESLPLIIVLKDKKQMNLITILDNKILKYTF